MSATHAGAGSFVLIPGGVTHDFENRGDVRAGVLNIFAPGTFEEQLPAIVELSIARTRPAIHASHSVHSQAIAAAVDIARGCGLEVNGTVRASLHEQPGGLARTNRGRGQDPCRARLAFAPGTRGRDRTECPSAPVVTPASGIPAIVHSRNGVDITFWRFHPQEPATDFAAARVAAGLKPLHAALAQMSPGLRARLPPYSRELDKARALLSDCSGIPALPDDDRRLLATAFDRLRASLDELAPPATHVVIHGGPHPYNVLLVDRKPLFIDFETTCTGPVEWDMAHVDPGAEWYAGKPLDRELLRVCGRMISVMTAVFCWSDVDRGDLREHAEYHLERIRRLDSAEIP